MPAPAWEDLGVFFDPADFAVSATITTQAGASRTVSGIFDDPYMNAELGEYDMDNTRPRFMATEADLEGIGRGDTLTLGAKSYDVLTFAQPTGDGLAVLELAEA